MNISMNNSTLFQPMCNMGLGGPSGSVINSLADKVDQEIHDEGFDSGSHGSHMAQKLNVGQMHETFVDMEAT